MPPIKSKAPAKTNSKAPAETNSVAKIGTTTTINTRAKAKAPTTIATAIKDAFVPLTEFTMFPKLPAELQLVVWKNCHFPRIVTLKPSKSQFPALLHACSDSRKECILAGYQFWIRDMKTGFVISPWKDILLLDKTSFSGSVDYHVNAFHTIRCRQVRLKMLRTVEKLAFSAREVLEIWKTLCFHCFLMSKLSELFPNLKELIVILRPGCLSAGHDDLYEVKDCTSPYLQSTMTDIQKAFNDAQKEGYCKDIELKMMRMESWST